MKKATKKVKLKKKRLKKIVHGEPSLKLVSYEIKAIIPTGPYANIQPTVVVQARNLEEASDYVIPHINKLFGEFLNRSERIKIVDGTGTTIIPGNSEINVYVKAKEVQTVDNNSGQPVVNAPQNVPVTESQVFIKAKQAINACASPEALKMIRERIEKSEKLNDKEKFDLVEMIISSPIK